MPLSTSRRFAGIVVAYALLTASVTVRADEAPAAMLAEVKHAFTIGGKPIPPEIFRDFGDGDLADSEDIWVTVDAAAATGSNLYYDDIRRDGDWVMQSKTDPKTKEKLQETGYKYVGVTANGLLVAIASFWSGGTGVFMTLHILDAAIERGFNNDGKPYPRINLTNVRTVSLGDRWDGDVKIAGNTLRIVTRQNGPVGGTQAPASVTAERP